MLTAEASELSVSPTVADIAELWIVRNPVKINITALH